MSESTSPAVQYIPAEEYDKIAEEEKERELEVLDWDTVMHRIANKGDPGKKLVIPRNKEFSRKDVVQAFQDAFELIGGTPRLALWAHANEGDFFKLYSRLLPSQASSALGEANEMVIRHVLPKGPLDE